MADKAKDPLIGKRIQLIYCSDQYTNLKPGDEGTVVFVDSLGIVSAKWDSGSNLGLIPGEDHWEVIS